MIKTEKRKKSGKEGKKKMSDKQYEYLEYLFSDLKVAEVIPDGNKEEE